MIAGAPRRHQIQGQSADASGRRLLPDRRVNVEHPGEDPLHIGVHAGQIVPEGDAGDSARRIRPHARQFAEARRVRGKHAPVALHDLPGGLVQMTGPGVVAQSLPQTQHFFFRRGGHSGHVGKTLHPAVEIGDAALHLRLLQHDLRNPDGIGRIVRPPGQGTLVRGKPVKKGRAQSAHPFGKRELGHGGNVYLGAGIVIRPGMPYMNTTRVFPRQYSPVRARHPVSESLRAESDRYSPARATPRRSGDAHTVSPLRAACRSTDRRPRADAVPSGILRR